MQRETILLRVVGILAAGTLGVAVGLFAQSSSLDRLSEEKVSISKMDWVLLNTRVYVLEQALKDDLSLPLSPTDYSYDSEKKKIRIAVNVDPTWLAHRDLNQRAKVFSARATALCIAPALADRSLTMAIGLAKAPNQYCSIGFFTVVPDKAGEFQPRDVAIYEDGKLSMK